MDDILRRALDAVDQARLTRDRADAALRTEIVRALLAGATQREVQSVSGMAMNTMRKVIAETGMHYVRGAYVSEDAA